MTFIKKILLLLLFLSLEIVLLIVTIYYSNNSEYTDNTKKDAVELQIIRRQRAIRPATIHYCKFNQYYDQEEGRCLGVPGGGKVLHIENGRSCGVNVLKPHCKSSLYYHICKRNKSILAQCANRQIFDNRLQRCVSYDSSKLTPSIISPDDYTHYDHVRMPRCTKYGRFPVPGYCSMFYTCDTNGHRLYQSVFKCPQNTGYQVDKGVCNTVTDCMNDNSVGTAVCVPNAPDENVESSSLNEAGDENAKEISEILKDNKTSTDDSTLEKEENVNFKTFDVITTTPINEIGPQSENNYNDNDNEESSNKAISPNPSKEDTIFDGIDEKMMYNQTPNQSETMQKAFDEGPNKEDGSSLLNLQITSPLTTEFNDTLHSISEQYTNNEDSTETSPNFKNDSVDLFPVPTSKTRESTPISDVSLNINEKMQDAATEQYKNNGDSIMPPSNSNTDTVDLHSTQTISNISEFSPVSDVLSNVDEKLQDAIIEQYKNTEDSTIMPLNFNTDSVNLAPTISNVPESFPTSDVTTNVDEKVQDAITEQYRNNEDTTMTPSNFNIETLDQYTTPIVNKVAESPPISEVSNVDEKTKDKIAEQYENVDSTMTPSNINIDSVDLAPTISNVPESSPISNTSPNIDEKKQDVATEEFKSNEDSMMPPSNVNIDSVDLHSTPTISNVPESSPISDVLSNADEKTQDAIAEQYKNEDSTMTPPNINTDSVDLAPTISNVPESSPISDASPNIDEKKQNAATEQFKNNEDSMMPPSNVNIDSVDLHSAPTISNVPKSSPISDVLSNVDEKTQDAATEQYENEDSTMTPSNINIDSVDLAPTISNVPESSPISNTSPNIDEKKQDVATEEFKSNEDSMMPPSNVNIDSVDLHSTPTISNVPESSPISDVLSNVDEKTQDAATEQYENVDSTMTPSNINTDSVDLAPTINNVPESSPISNTSPNIDEKKQDVATEEFKSNEDSMMPPSNVNIDSVDLHSTPTISNVPESSPISDVLSNADEKTQDAIAEQYKNEDSTMTPPNINTDSVDLAPTISNVPESSPISDASPNIDEKKQNAATEQFKNNEDSMMPPSNVNIDSVDLHSAPTISNVPKSSPISDVLSNVDEKTQDAATEQYENEDSTMTPSNINIDSVDLAPTISNVPESSPISNT
ncbi:PREDICTED: protein PF14_0175-like [Cyphomyrmex costatus]|uniref:protein PF14_0175-like n=1 Tax=Cyphomyrmex costatus TaxID=456900 RepID=UPI00085239C3|nr:PREDICTED: protein PF14_0175-like [Cyphomyrmex costatus]